MGYSLAPGPHWEGSVDNMDTLPMDEEMVTSAMKDCTLTTGF